MRAAYLIKGLRDLGIEIYYGHVVKADLRKALASLWDGKGELYEKYETLWKELVPESGKAGTKEGELLRSISRIYYDYYNNGWGNDWEDELEIVVNSDSIFDKYLDDPYSLQNFYSSAEPYASGNWEIDDHYEEENEGEVDLLPDPFGSKKIEKALEDVTSAIVKSLWEKTGKEVKANLKVLSLDKSVVEDLVKSGKKLTDQSLQDFVNERGISKLDDINDLMYDLESKYQILNLKKPTPAKILESKEMSVVVDFSNWESADSGDTTHYGGFAMIGDEKIAGRGTDRDGDVWTDILMAIIEHLGIEDASKFGDAQDQIMEVVHLLDTDPLKRTITYKNSKVEIPGLENFMG